MRMMKRSIGTLCLAMICAGPPALCAQELSGGVSTVSVGADEASSFGIRMIRTDQHDLAVARIPDAGLPASFR